MSNKKFRITDSRASATTWRSRDGFSLVEMLIVLLIIGILTAISVPYLLNYKQRFKSEDQALKVMDIMREAGQLAITRRRTMRVEIDRTDNAILLIDEMSTAPDVLLKKIPLEAAKDVRMDVAPTGITKPNPPNYNDAVYASDSLGHQVGAATITNHTVWAARFKSDGSVVNAADAPFSATLYAWPPSTVGSPNARSSTEVRAITFFGGTGSVRYWRYNGSTFVASQ